MSDDEAGFQSPTALKIATAKEKKDVADAAFRQGNVKDALRSYHEALMYLLGLDKNALQSVGMAPPSSRTDPASEAKEKTEHDEMIEKIYANMAACHMKQGNWKRVVETAEKALAKNESNYKAMFRKGKALGEQGYFEKAVKILEEVREKSPADAAAVDAELTRLRAIDAERERVNRHKLKGFLNKAEKKTTADSPTKALTPEPA